MPPRTRTGGRITPAVVVGAGVVVVLLAGVLLWAGFRSSGPTITGPAASTAPAGPTTAAEVASAQATAVVSSSGLVRLDPSVSHPAALAVLTLLDRHFSAINARDYAAWTETVVPQRAAHQPMSTWRSAYRSTQDQNVEVLSITASAPDSVNVALSFMSTQDPADAPADLQAARICWQSTWPIVDLSGGGRIATPARGSTTDAVC